MIRPFTFTCPRDWACFELLVQSAEALHDSRLDFFTAFHDPKEPPNPAQKAFAEHHGVLFRERFPNFSPWSEQSGLVKFEGFHQFALDSREEDLLVHIDSDGIFYSKTILDALSKSISFAGFEHSERRFISTLGRPWTWTGGSFQVASHALILETADEYWNDDTYKRALHEMRNQGLSTVNDDVVVSYLFAKHGAETKNLGPWGGVQDLEAIVLGNETPRSFVHYGTDAKPFLGFPRAPKWKFPEILRERGYGIPPLPRSTPERP